MRQAWGLAVLTWAGFVGAISAQLAASAPSEAELAMRKFKLPPGLKADLWAAEPMLANPVSLTFDEKGRVYVCETFRLHDGVDDIRNIMDWLDEELASRSPDERLAEMKRHLGNRFSNYTNQSERISLLEDRAGSGHADHAGVFADGFNHPLDGIGAGVLARNGNVWYANIPNLWLLRDTNGDGVADFRQSLHYGFGVRVGFLGHDLHGLHFGPDGKIYFSIGDRGSNVRLADGRRVGDPESGCVFRCEPDGSDLEMFCNGLRNPQDLVFDQYGNLFTGDNNSDSGDEARWVYLVEGADNGWRVGYQFMENPYSRGPFNAEKLWYPPFTGQSPRIVPPIANIASGPSGVAYFPGTGLPDRYQDHFFLVDFRGGPADSGIHTFTLRPKGAGFEVVAPEHFVWGSLATDVKFGVDGGVYFTDWVEGWEKTGKGRIYRIHDPALDADSLVLETKRLMAVGMEHRSLTELGALLAHRDIRVRQDAQFELAARGYAAIDMLMAAAVKAQNPLARLHGIWGLGQILGGHSIPWPGSITSGGMIAGQASAARVGAKELMPAITALLRLLSDPDPEVRAQSARVLGDRRVQSAADGLLKLLQDQSPRVRFFATMALGKLGRRDAVPAILAMLRENADRDPWLRHAGVMALTWIGDLEALLGAARDPSPSVRIAVLLTLRRDQHSEVAQFLHDSDPTIVLEAARAINDEPVTGGTRELAALITTAMSGPDPEPLIRRVLNANLHLGTADSAKALASYAARSDAPAKMRALAMEELADWEHPSGRDRVVGLWRPVAGARLREDATRALEPHLADLLRSAPESVRIATLRASSRLSITNVTALLVEMAADAKLPVTVRIESLGALVTLGDARREAALDAAQNDPNEEIRKAATALLAVAGTANPVAKLSATLERGSLPEKQTALAVLGSLPDPAVDEILGSWMRNLLDGKVPKELALDVLEASTKREAEPVKKRLARYRASLRQDDPLAEYLPALFGGSAPAGHKVFFDKPEAQCVRCHKIEGKGGDVGPDLSHIGGQKDRTYLLESIVLPNKQIAPGFESVMVVLKNGDSYAGVLKSENDTELVVNSPDTGPVTVKKTEISSRRTALSPMPEGLTQGLSKNDLRNLVEFLSSLK